MAQKTTYACDGCNATMEHGTAQMAQWFRIEFVIYCEHGPSQHGLDVCPDCAPRFTELLATAFPMKFAQENSEARH